MHVTITALQDNILTQPMQNEQLIYLLFKIMLLLFLIGILQLLVIA